MGGKLALETDLWYNKHINIVLPEGVRSTFQALIHLSLKRRCIMDTLPPHATNGKFAVLYPPVDETYRFYVYALSYPESMGGLVFYIGKGQGNRINAHEWQARKGKDNNPHKYHVIRSIWNQGEQVVKTKLAFFQTNEEALQYEIALIFFFSNLTNITDGGEGVVGWTPTEETKRKISAAVKGKNGGIRSEEHRQKLHNGLRRGPLTAESRRKISEAKKGRPITEEHRQKVGDALRGRVQSEEHRRKKGDALQGHVHSEETRRKISEATKGRTAHNKGKPMSEEQKLKVSQARKGTRASEETKRKMSETRKGMVIPDDQRRRMIEANRGQKRTPEQRARISEAAKLRWARKREEMDK